MQSGRDGGSLYAYYDGYDIDEVERRLSGVKHNLPIDVAWAANRTMRFANRELKRAVASRYRITQRDTGKGMKTRSANARNTVAEIRAEGEALPIKHFTATHAKTGVKVAQLKSNAVTRLEVDGRKAFWATMKNPKGRDGEERDYTGVFQRTSRKRFPIRKIFGSSVPKMIGGETSGVYRELQPKLVMKLEEYTEKRIRYRLRMAER